MTDFTYLPILLNSSVVLLINIYIYIQIQKKSKFNPKGDAAIEIQIEEIQIQPQRGCCHRNVPEPFGRRNFVLIWENILF